jgi:hypothetical protein
MKRVIIGIIYILLLLAILTGCSAITKTFGKEYRLVDDFYDQLEADIRFSVNEYTSTQKDYSERKNEIDNRLDVLIADIKIARNTMKLQIEDFKKNADELGFTGSISDYIEKGLLEARISIEQKFKEETDGKFTLKHAEVNRDFFGSIWHFVRNHWLITLIIFGAVCALIEKLQEFWSQKVKIVK